MGFEEAVELVFLHEGGYIDDPDDPGGATRFGISRRSHPDIDIANLTRRRASEIYRQQYWIRCRCDDLPSPLATLVFDAAVNQGPEAAIRMLQRAVGAVVDGVIGPDTLVRARRLGRDRNTVLNLAAERGYRYGRTRNFDRYGRGWMRRLMAVLAQALEESWV